jgi:tetratricopeptide (TPR) repeat protein
LVSAREQLADVYAAAGSRAARTEQMEALFALDKRAPRHVALALSYAQGGETTRAVRMLRNASELYPDDAETYLALGRIWLDIARASGDHIARSKAIEALHHAAALAPSSAAFALLGEARLDAADAPLAERTLRQAAEKLPADTATFLQLADAAERAGHTQAARRALLDYHSLTAPGDPRRTEAARRIAELSMRLGESRVAVTWYQRATEDARPSSALLLRLAEAQLQAGDTAGARKTVERITDREPAHAAARAFESKLRD